jgi:FixJ family two-component response regulator
MPRMGIEAGPVEKSAERSADRPVICIVDDDETMRSWLKLVLQSAGYEVAEYATASDFLDAYRFERPGCLVLDVRMPGIGGMELQDRLNARGAIVPVIFISGSADVPTAVEAVRQGAFDFLQKPVREQALITCVQEALERDAGNRSQLRELQELRSRVESLTQREHEVLLLITRGLANKVIASDLGLSQRTVELHRARVMEKMQAQSLAQLVRMMIVLEQHAEGRA